MVSPSRSKCPTGLQSRRLSFRRDTRISHTVHLEYRFVPDGPPVELKEREACLMRSRTLNPTICWQAEVCRAALPRISAQGSAR